MPVEQFRGYVASIVAALLAVGALGIAAWAWYQPIDPQNSDGMFRTETVTTEPIPGGAE
jgi:hypothetical protein